MLNSVQEGDSEVWDATHPKFLVLNIENVQNFEGY